MAKIILQPTGNKDARDHYVNTIQNPVSASKIKAFEPSISAQLDLMYPDGKVYIWGVIPGVKDVNKKKWDRIAKGDVTLFSNRGIFASAVTTLKFHNKALAVDLWGYDSKGNTWEYIYLVKEVKNTVIPYSQLNPTLGYDSNYIIQGFGVLDQEKSDKLFAKFDLYSDVFCEDTTEQEFNDAIDSLENEDSLESEHIANARKEQTFLRNYLFKGKTVAKCGICGKTLPIDFLITSHIKKRCDCTKTEKLDYENIVMPMCKFGCDDAYEKGYIYVDQTGIIHKNSDKPSTADMDAFLNSVDGKNCSYHSTNTEKYFKAHRAKFGK